MEIAECTWKDIFDDSERKRLDEGFFLTGFFSIALGVWLNLSILSTNLNLDRSYRTLANFTVAACIRRVVALIAHVHLCFFERDYFDLTCEFFAFLDTFLAVFEIEWLTHVCIERYVVAKYTTKGWPVQNYHYALYQYLCLFFASLYSIPPLLGIGHYGFDFSCSFCTFDMILPESFMRYVVVVIFILRSIKPAMVMTVMLIWTCIMERNLVCSKETQEQVKFTENVIIVTFVSLICWSPIALIRGNVILSQLMYSHPVAVSSFYIKWAMLIHWMSPAFVAVTLFAVDKKIRGKMFYLKFTKAEVETNDKKD